MKTKLLYVLVSSEKDIYLEQAYISMMSARHHMPDVNITLVIDQFTQYSLVGIRKKILDITTKLIVIDLPENLSGQKRSRILKTSVRNHVTGDFLFIDCDTIVLQPLDFIDSLPYEIAACRDSHSSFDTNPYRNMIIGHCSKIGCNIVNEHTYFNSGVLLVKDTPLTHIFYTEWNRNWQKGMKEHGVLMDQPSFAKTNISLNHVVKELSDIWNCQIIHGVKYLRDAKILHYLCTSPTKKGDTQIFILRNKKLLEDIKNNMIIEKNISECFDDPFMGIPECVHVLAGKNIELCQSHTFKYFERIIGTKTFRIYDKVYRVLNLFHKLLVKMLNNR